MIDDFKTGKEIRADKGSDIGGEAVTDLRSDLEGEKGVDLNKNDSLAKSVNVEAMPANMNQYNTLNDDRLAYITEVPNDCDPTRWIERLQTQFPGLTISEGAEKLPPKSEGMPREYSQWAHLDQEERKRRSEEALERNNVNEPEYEDRPPETETTEQMDTDASLVEGSNENDVSKEVT
jgi:hypothetical protein